jgi:transmembrane sensor
LRHFSFLFVIGGMTTMHDQAPSRRNGDDLAEQAVHWHVRMTSGEVSSREAAAFEHWKSEPRHARAYDEIAQIWSALGPALEAPQKIVPLERARQSRFVQMRSMLSSRSGMAIAASLAVAALTGYQYDQVWRYDHVAQGSKREVVALADGSRVTLNTGAALNVEYTAGVRRVRLGRGEAYFDVQHNPAKPFVVNAGNGDVTVLGTAFSVRRSGDGASVIVRRGKVRVRAGNDSADITPGQMIVYSNGHEGPIRKVDANAALAWSDGRLVFENKPLGEVIDAIDRYYPGMLIFTSKAKADRRVNAVVNLDRIDDWLDALSRSQGVAVRRLPAITLLN